MRSALLGVTLCGLLLTGAACGSGGDSGTEPIAEAPAVDVTTPATAIAAPNYYENTRTVCAALDKIFDADVAQFGTAMGRMIAYKEAKQADEAELARKAASKELKEVGEKIRKETSKAEDPDLKEAGQVSATKFSKSAADKGLFDKVKTTTDLNKTLLAKMPDWMDPVAGLCAT
ncbi:hypothetical protein ACFQFC_25725 [Amorphoplanes digitatis]|uniref:Secreted protein n=1 Tax=Actinoplanes digitatis TaxID=1868 RepID=A0A7W7HRR3_9ACTN|nr:hypothetical protein [Actinoplanes digitatis]MBB4759538.1 hypothetical protein [Actinoplanes digitatis]BFE67405.1 hypothetical protein GCM10020092_007060 [Actinoplanes digitatis]GID94935.1 hypothetical protein Adi01nite_43470 [Actinoplanes digitatis]